jgi:hypothetical protein
MWKDDLSAREMASSRKQGSWEASSGEQSLGEESV